MIISREASTRDSDADLQERRNNDPLILFHQYDHALNLAISRLTKLQSPSFVVKADHSKRFLALGRSDGHLEVVSLFDHQTLPLKIQVEQNSVVTNLRWRPLRISENKVLVAVTSQGLISHIHYPSGRPLLNQREQGHSILALDFNASGSTFVTAGRDCGIRVYDEAMKTQVRRIQKSKWDSKGHSNRIFSLKFIDENVLISGGWDSVLHIWDLRADSSQRTIYGPHLSGDSIDFREGLILTGSHRDKQQIQLIELGQGKLLKSIGYSNAKSVPYVYSTIFLPKGDICAGSSGLNELRVFGRQYEYQSLNSIEMGGGCYSLQSSGSWISYCNSVGDFCILTY